MTTLLWTVIASLLGLLACAWWAIIRLENRVQHMSDRIYEEWGINV